MSTEVLPLGLDTPTPVTAIDVDFLQATIEKALALQAERLTAEFNAKLAEQLEAAKAANVKHTKSIDVPVFDVIEDQYGNRKFANVFGNGFKVEFGTVYNAFRLMQHEAEVLAYAHKHLGYDPRTVDADTLKQDCLREKLTKPYTGKKSTK